MLVLHCHEDVRAALKVLWQETDHFELAVLWQCMQELDHEGKLDQES